MANKDANYTNVLKAINDSGDPQALQADEITGRLLIDITVVSSLTGGTPSAERDANYVNTPLVYDETNDTTHPLLCDASGLLILDVNVE